jgi:hypothetical protein
MQDQPVLAPWTLILVEHVRSGRGVWTFASDWTYAWSPLLLFHSSLSLLGLTKHRPLICTWAANQFPPWSASPPKSSLLLFFLITAFTFHCSSGVLCPAVTFIPFSFLLCHLSARPPSRFLSIYPLQSDFPFSFSYQISVWPLLAFVYLRP